MYKLIHVFWRRTVDAEARLTFGVNVLFHLRRLYVLCVDILDVTSQHNLPQFSCFHVLTTATPFSWVLLRRHWHLYKESQPQTKWPRDFCSAWVALTNGYLLQRGSTIQTMTLSSVSQDITFVANIPARCSLRASIPQQSLEIQLWIFKLVGISKATTGKWSYDQNWPRK